MARIIALDLGAHSIKATVFELSGRRLELQDRVSAPVPQDGSEIPGREARLAALDALLEENARWKAPGNDIGVVFPSEDAVLHRMTVPFTDQAQIEQTLPFAVEEEVPFDVDDMVLGWRAISKDSGTTCLVALAREDRVAGLLADMAARQVDPRLLQVDGDLLGYFGGEAPIAIVDVGHARTLITVARGGQTLAARSVDVGGWHFTQAIAEALECSWAEAERLKHDAATDGASGSHLPPEAARAVDAQMGLLLAGIRSALITVEDALGVELSAVQVAGGGARLAPFTDYLRQDLGLEVVPLHEPSGEPVPGPYAATHALGMQLGGRGKGAIDLRVESFAYRGGTDILKTVGLGSGVVTAVFMLAAAAVFVLQYSQIYSEQSEMDALIRDYTVRTFDGVTASQITDSTRAVALAAAVTEDAAQRARVLGSVDGKPPTIDLLHGITNAFPKPDEVTVDVSELYITPSTVTLDAEVDGYTEAAAVEAALKSDKRFAEASKGEDKRKREKVLFTITIPLSDDGEEG
ncbi:MAG: hypothetical protein EP330_25505 [Deltaproteobacteria bacterium]|nr:MAG: hypothetical protein EP330_25505 [Deltaproteobacteria bacterium]